MKHRILLFTVLLAPLPVFAQPVAGHFVSVGATGGVSLTDAFSDRIIMGVDTSTHLYSASKDYVVGPSLEIRLPLNFSAEFDALYRPMNLTEVNTIFPSFNFTASGPTHAWEFPLLAKYRMPTHPIKPFAEAGPSLRKLRLFDGDSPHLSRAGFTIGAGVGFSKGPLKVDPEIRYTRWGSDSNPSTTPFNPVSNVNQAELLLGLRF